MKVGATASGDPRELVEARHGHILFSTHMKF